MGVIADKIKAKWIEDGVSTSVNNIDALARSAEQAVDDHLYKGQLLTIGWAAVTILGVVIGAITLILYK